MHGRGDPVASICVTEKTVMKTRGTRRRSAHQSRHRILVTSTASSTGSSRSCRRKRARPSSTLASRLAERTRWAYRLAIASHPFCTSRSTLTMSSKLLSGCTRDCAEISTEIAAENAAEIAFRTVSEIARDCTEIAGFTRNAMPSPVLLTIGPFTIGPVPEIAPRLHRDWTRDQWTRALTNASDTVRLPVCRGNLVGNQVAGRKSESLLSQEVSTLPTSISGGVRQDVPLSPALVARLAIAGGLCSATTRAVTSPIDLIKTRRQAAIKTAKAPAGTPTPPSLNSTAQSEQHIRGIVPGVGDPPPPTAAATAPPPPPSSPFLGIEASIAAGFAAGAGSFGTFEFLRRTIPQLAAFVMGPAAPADLATPILFTACLLQAVAASVCSSPFETARVKIMTGSGAPDAPQNLVEALDLVMRGDAPAARAATEGAGVATTSTKLSLTMPDESSRQRAAASSAAVGTLTPATARVVSSTAQRDKQRDVLRLWDGLPTLMGRELPFGVRTEIAPRSPPLCDPSVRPL